MFADDPSAELHFLRRLAGDLVHDPHRADDLAQEAWLAARREAGERPRSWYWRVLRNALRQQVRSEARRRRREEEAADLRARGTAPTDSADETHLVRLRRALGGLSAAQRQVLELRYLEELGPTEIAARLGRPRRTVEGQLHRGLERLRVALGVERGSRRPLPLWLAAWWPRSARGAAVLGLALGAGGLAAALSLDRGGAALPAPPTMASATAADLAPRNVGSAATSEIRTAAAPEIETAAIDAEERGPQLLGQVLTADGQPAAGARVRAGLGHLVMDRDAPPVPAAETWAAEDGTFALALPTPLPPGALRVEADRPGEVSLLGTYVSDGRVAGERRLYLAPATTLSGTVFEAGGRPSPRTRVRFSSPRIPVGAAAAPLSPARAMGAVDTDEAGAFRLEQVPLAAGVALEVERAGWVTLRLEVTQLTSPVRLVLEADPTLRVHSGRVSHRGAPVAGATVLTADVQLTSDREGRFEWAVPADFGATEIAVGARGYRGALRTVGAQENSVELELGGPALELAGEVRDGSGRPAAGVLVLPYELPILPQRPNSRRTTLEELCAPTEAPPVSRTDGEGRFRLGGLQPGSYRLLVLEPHELVGLLTEPLAAGSADLHLELGRSALAGLRGTVRGRDGAPVAGARLRPLVESRRFDTPIDFDPVDRELAETRTDADGSFHLEHADLSLWFEVSAPGYVAADVRLVPGEMADVALDRSRRLEVRLADDRTEVHAAEVFDADGAKLTLHAVRGVEGWSMDVLDLTPGQPVSCLLSERAAVLRLRAGDRLVTERAVPAGHGDLSWTLP
jgi:RNA polymerase sigma factor (sigma-70 family)